MVERFAGVKCSVLSAVSAEGLTVAALAAHMEEADMQFFISRGALAHALV